VVYEMRGSEQRGGWRGGRAAVPSGGTVSTSVGVGSGSRDK